MAQRKVFSDKVGRELSYHVTSTGELEIAITTDDVLSITLDAIDALSFIQELNKLKKQLRDDV